MADLVRGADRNTCRKSPHELQLPPAHADPANAVTACHPSQLVTTSYVFDEIVTFFNSRGRHAKAVEIGQRLLQSASVEIVHVDIPLFEAGWSYFQQRADKQYSLTDCISFVLMRREKLQQALTFDRHFEQAGFTMAPVRGS